MVGETLGYVGEDLVGGALKEVSGVLRMWAGLWKWEELWRR